VCGAFLFHLPDIAGIGRKGKEGGRKKTLAPASLSTPQVEKTPKGR